MEPPLITPGIIFTTMVMSLVMSGLLAMFTWKLLSLVKRELYRKKLKKIDLSCYDVFGTSRNGWPAILQNKKNPNDFIFLQ